MSARRDRVRTELEMLGWTYTPTDAFRRALTVHEEALAAVEDGASALVHVAFVPHVRDLHVPCRTPHLTGGIVGRWCRHGVWVHPRPRVFGRSIRNLLDAVDGCRLRYSVIEFHPLAAVNGTRLVSKPIDTMVGEYLSRFPADCKCDPELHLTIEEDHDGTLADPNRIKINTGHETWCEQYDTPGSGDWGMVSSDGRFMPFDTVGVAS